MPPAPPEVLLWSGVEARWAGPSETRHHHRHLQQEHQLCSHKGTLTVWKHFSSSPDSRMVEFAFRFCCQPLDPAEVTSFNYGVWRLTWKLKKIILVSPPKENLFIFFGSKMFFMRFHTWKKCLNNSEEFCFAQTFSCGLTLGGEVHKKKFLRNFIFLSVSNMAKHLWELYFHTWKEFFFFSWKLFFKLIFFY